jgi:hypothetical protein
MIEPTTAPTVPSVPTPRSASVARQAIREARNIRDRSGALASFGDSRRLLARLTAENVGRVVRDKFGVTAFVRSFRAVTDEPGDDRRIVSRLLRCGAGGARGPSAAANCGRCNSPLSPSNDNLDDTEVLWERNRDLALPVGLRVDVAVNVGESGDTGKEDRPPTLQTRSFASGASTVVDRLLRSGFGEHSCGNGC